MLRLITLVLSGALLSGMVWAEGGRQNHGVINFYGVVVEDQCTITIHSDMLHSACHRPQEGEPGRVLRSVSDLNNLANHGGTIPGHVGSVNITWMDSTRTAGVLTINQL